MSNAVTNAPTSRTNAPVICAQTLQLYFGIRSDGEGRIDSSSDHETQCSVTNSKICFVNITDPIRLRFMNLTAQWKALRSSWLSSVQNTAMLEPYQKIIALGEAAIPLILDELVAEGDEPDDWFWALNVIADHDPVPAVDQGIIVRMAEAWIRWGRERYA